MEIKNELGNFKLDVINKVLDKMALFDTWDLVSKTHELGTPWHTVYHSNKTSNNSCFSPIDHSIIYNYYKIKENKSIKILFKLLTKMLFTCLIMIKNQYYGKCWFFLI